jgi:hypothetical protein
MGKHSVLLLGHLSKEGVFLTMSGALYGMLLLLCLQL